MTTEELEQIKQYEWDKFTRRYPSITSKNPITRIILAFSKRDQYLLWENGFLQGWLQCKKHEEHNN